jgi:type II secretory ATPase GspE/PulE/Tfp pilus assembly ATPase PilB-like protein
MMMLATSAWTAAAETPAALAQGVMLLSPLQPLLIFLCLAGWAWVVATIYDPDAERWYLARSQWNTVHLALATAALAAAVLLPWVVGIPAMIALLLVSLGAYWVAHNRSDRVPAGEKWTLSLDEWKARKAARAEGRRAAGSKLTLSGPGGDVRVPPKETPEYELRMRVEEMLLDAVDKRATDLEILPAKDGVYAKVLTIDGVQTKPEPIREKEAVAAIDLLKTAAGLDVADRRRKLAGEFTVAMGDAAQRVALQTSGGSSGLKARILFNPGARVRFGIADLGLLPRQQEAAEELILEKGVVLVAAPPRQGRTSTMYSLVRQHDAYVQNVQTIELDPQDTLEGVKTTKYDPLAEGPDYATSLRSILRRDPDVVMVGELPDQETAKEVCAADQDRTRSYVGLRGDNSLAAVQGFVKGVGDAKAAAEPLRGVLAQKLARKLCENCKAEYRPSAEMLKKLGVPKDKAPASLYRKGGQVLIKNKPETCPVCRGTGFVGQVGVIEIFPLDSSDRELIAQEDWAGLRTALKKKRLPTIQEAAVAKVLEGVTSVEEVVRITSSGRSAKPSSGGGAAKPAQTSQASG